MKNKINELEINIGRSPTKNMSIKTLKYRGQYLHIVYLPELKSYIPFHGFRSLKKAQDHLTMNEDWDEDEVITESIDVDSFYLLFTN